MKKTFDIQVSVLLLWQIAISSGMSIQMNFFSLYNFQKRRSYKPKRLEENISDHHHGRRILGVALCCGYSNFTFLEEDGYGFTEPLTV